MLQLTLLFGLVNVLFFGTSVAGITNTASFASTIFNANSHVALFDEVLVRILRYRNISNVPIFIGANDENRTTFSAVADSLDRRLFAARYIFTIADNSTSPGNSLRNYITSDTLSVILCDSPNDRIWRVVDQRLRKLRQTAIVVVATSASLKPVDIFDKIWQLQFLQAVLLFNDTIYNYTPYPHVQVFQVSDNSSDLYPRHINNLQGYVISTPIESDLPRIFFVGNHTGQLSNIRGFAYQFISTFTQRMNITLRISNPDVVHEVTSSPNMSQIAQQIALGELELSIHPFTFIHEEQGVLSYPIFNVDRCLIVPWQNEILRCWYPLRPLKWGSWFIICISVVYIAVALTWTSPCVPRDAPFLTKLSRTFLESLAQVAFLSHTYQTQQPSLRYIFVYLQLALFGFLLTSLYNNLLSSFYTAILVGDQLDTFESLIEERLPILTKFEEVCMVLDEVPHNLVKQVQKLIIGANSSVQMSHLLDFNNSYAYPVTEERWNFLTLQEQYSNKPINRFSKICLGSPNIGFPMRLDSHLERVLNAYLLDIQMAGLDVYWLTSSFNDAMKERYVKLVNSVFPIKPIDLFTLSVAWILLFGGLSIAFGVFLIEIRVTRRSGVLSKEGNAKKLRN